MWLRTCCARMKEPLNISEKKMRLVTAIDLIKCLQQIKKHRLLHTYALTSELPSNIGKFRHVIIIQQVFYSILCTNRFDIILLFSTIFQ